MLDIYLGIFETTATQLVTLIVPVFGVYLVVKLVADLLFDR